MDPNPLRYREGQLYDHEGNVVQYSRAVAEYGDRYVWFVILWGEVTERVGRRLPPYPPRVFVSYRWHSEEHPRCVERLANRLRESGYEVVLDQWFTFSTRVEVPRFVARLAECHYAVIVLTTEYIRVAKGDAGRHIFLAVPHHTTGNAALDRKMSTDGWVADEIIVATRLVPTGLKVIYALKTDEPIPTAYPTGTSVDFRRSDSVDQILDTLPPYQGPRLSPAEGATFGEIMLLYHQLIVAMERRGSRETTDRLVERLEQQIYGIPNGSPLRGTSEIILMASALRMSQEHRDRYGRDPQSG